MVIIGREHIEKSLGATVTRLRALTEDGVKVARMPDGSLSITVDAMACLRPLIVTGGIDNTLRATVIDACKRAEMTCVGSAKYVIRCLSNMLRLQVAGHTDRDLQAASAIAVGDISAASRPASMAVLESVLRDQVPQAADIVLEAVKLAGCECKIFVEPSTSNVTAIEKVVGYTFRTDPDASFFRAGKWAAYDAKCFVVDGMIDSVSEIDLLLQRCHETRTPMAIFARGFSPEVLVTLRTNFIRKTLSVIPVSVEFDLETVNILLDIASVVGCDVTSSLKGELISTVGFDDIPRARLVTCSRGTTTITNDGTVADVQLHARELIRKRNEETLPAMRQIIDMRIKSLSSSSVMVRVTDAGSRGSNLMHEIDIGLKLVRSMLTHGVVDPAGLSGMTGEILGGITRDPCPTLMLASGIHYGSSVLSSLRSVANAVVSDVASHG